MSDPVHQKIEYSWNAKDQNGEEAFVNASWIRTSSRPFWQSQVTVIHSPDSIKARISNYFGGTGEPNIDCDQMQPWLKDIVHTFLEFNPDQAKEQVLR